MAAYMGDDGVIPHTRGGEPEIKRALVLIPLAPRLDDFTGNVNRHQHTTIEF